MYKLRLVLLSSILLTVGCSTMENFFGFSENPPARATGVTSQNQKLDAEIAALRQELKDLQGSIERKKAEARASLEAEEAARSVAEASREVIPMDRLWVTVSFRSGFMELTRQSRKALAQLAQKFISKKRVQTLDVRGYTDDEPVGGYPGSRHKPRHSYKNNLALSKARANSVTRVLVDAGIPDSAIQAQGYGSTDFIASNKTASGRAKNRRTEIHLVRR